MTFLSRHSIALRGAALLSIELDVPSADIVGFAHPPKTAAQWKVMRAGSEKLLAGASMFVLPADSERCRAQHVDVVF